MTDIAGPGFAARSDVGRVRQANEDSFLARPPLFAIADGMGGANAGEVASALAISHLEGRVAGATLAAVREAIEAANADVRRKAAADPALQGMGTTCTVALIDGLRVHLAHVGDSRAYLLRGGVATQLTDDHSLVASMVRDGLIDAAEAASDERRNIITRAVGVDERIDVDVKTVETEPGDRVLLCSDGLSGMLSDAEIGALGSGGELEDVARALIDRANEAGGVDNATVILVEPALVEVPELAATPASASAAAPTTEVHGRRSARAWRLLTAALALAVLGVAAYLFTSGLGTGTIEPTPSPTVTSSPTPDPSSGPANPSPSPEATPDPSGGAASPRPNESIGVAPPASASPGVSSPSAPP